MRDNEGVVEKNIEFLYLLCYIIYRKSAHSKVDASEMIVNCPYGHRLICLQTGEAFFILPEQQRHAAVRAIV